METLNNRIKTMRLGSVTAETWNLIRDRVEKQPQGYFVYYKGIDLPQRAYFDVKKDVNHNLRALEALGTVKKFLFSLSFLSGLVIPRTLNVRKYDAFLVKLYQLCEWQLFDYFVKDDEWSLPVWEIGKFIRNFLKELGFSEVVYTGYSKVIMCLLEFDTAYRYRVQDLLSSVDYLDKDTLRYIIKLYAVREENLGAAEKINKITKLIYWALWIPKLKKALKNAHKEVNWENVRIDEKDRRDFCWWRGYNFEGKTFEERYTPYTEMYKKAPYVKRQNPQVTLDFMTE